MATIIDSVNVKGTKYEVVDSASRTNITNLTTRVTDLEKETGKSRKLYAFHISPSESDPASKVTYLEDAVGMTPAKMDYSTGKFNYGSWKDAFFMPKPCMVKSNGTVDYYLNPDDLTKKEDGTASDVSNTAYDGNAMMEWGQNGRRIWYKLVPDLDDTGVTAYISDGKLDDGFHDYSFINSNGKEVDHFYTPIYNGSVIDGKMRSLSGQKVSSKLTRAQEITDASANGDGWYTETFCDAILIGLLLTLMAKTTDVQAAYGQGITTPGETGFNAYVTGALNTKGLFYGSSGTNTAVKVFGTENYWGLQWRACAGFGIKGGHMVYKMTPAYSTDFTGYTDSGIACAGTSGGYIKKRKYLKDGVALPYEMSGSSTTYYCDGTWFNNGATTYALRGGRAANGSTCGLAWYLTTGPGYAYWDIGAALSLKPLA